MPPGATASSTLRTPRPSGVRGIDAYCADTRSNASAGERAERVGIGVVALDGQPAALGLGGDPVERALGDVARRHPPALLGQPERVAALAGADVEGAAGVRPAISLTSVPFGLPLQICSPP